MTVTSNDVSAVGVASRALVSPGRLGQIVAAIAGQPREWRPIVQFSEDHRWYGRLDPAGPDADYEVWLLSWLPGQQTGFHDHGEAVGAFAIADGELREVTGVPGRRTVRDRALRAGAVRTFGPAHTHDVRNVSARPAVSVHAYSPPLSAMRRYQLTSSGLVLAGIDTAEESW
jgi:mannose-6-phosphate isomerase-like protein (cupin superfamily)